MSSPNLTLDSMTGEIMIRVEHRKPWVTIALFAVLICITVNNEVMGIIGNHEIEGQLIRVCGIIASFNLWGLPLLAMLVGIYYFTGVYSRSFGFLWTRIIPTALISCAFWWAVTAVIQMQQNYPNEADMLTFMQCMSEVLDAPANIRFLQMICSMFLLYPLLQRIVRHQETLRYSLIALFAMTIIEPLLHEIPYCQIVTVFLDQLNWGFFRAWGFYVLLGVYLDKHQLTWQNRLLLYTLAIISVGVVFLLDVKSLPNYRFMSFDSPFSALQAVAVAILIRQVTSRDTSILEFISTDGMWSYMPAIFVAGAICDRLPIDEGNTFYLLATRSLIIVFISVLFIYVFSRLKGFRTLIGCFDKAEEVLK